MVYTTYTLIIQKCILCKGLPLALVVKNLPVNAGDIRGVGSVPGLGRFPGGSQGTPLQYSYLENPMDRGAWWATVQRAAKSRTWLGMRAHMLYRRA